MFYLTVYLFSTIIAVSDFSHVYDPVLAVNCCSFPAGSYIYWKVGISCKLVEHKFLLFSIYIIIHLENITNSEISSPIHGTRRWRSGAADLIFFSISCKNAIRNRYCLPGKVLKD